MNAADLPGGSIVAGIDCTFLKHSTVTEPDQPWSGGPDRRFVNDYTNDEIDDMLQQGAVQVLRVGTGE